MAQMEEWRTKYPEAFAREYDPASGLRFNAWIDGGEVTMAKKVFVIDIARCNGCHNCQIVCKDEHVGNDWTPIAKPQPDTGQFWMELTEKVRGTVPKVKVAYRPHLCMHCDNAPCIDVLPGRRRALQARRRPGHHRHRKCTGCRICVDACPYDVIFFNEDLNLAQKCTGCAHLLDDGWAEPRCADACPTAGHPAAWTRTRPRSSSPRARCGSRS